MRMLPESDLFHREDLSLQGTGEDMPLFYQKVAYAAFYGKMTVEFIPFCQYFKTSIYSEKWRNN